MSTKNDPWYSPVVASSGRIVSGAAALNVRIKAQGGMSDLIARVCMATLKEANLAAQQNYLATQDNKLIKFPKSQRKKSA